MPEMQPGNGGGIVGVHLGIDFGTSYTKASYRIRGKGYNLVKIVPIKIKDNVTGIIPSLVYEGKQGSIWTPLSEPESSPETLHRFLKAKVAGFTGFMSSDGMEKNPRNEKEYEKNTSLAIFFIAEIIRYSRQVLEKSESLRLAKSKVQWSAKICVPLGEKNNEMIKNFAEIYAKAWELSQAARPDTVEKLKAILSNIHVVPADSPCQPYPEVGAAVYSFLLTRDAVPGLYYYLDVGGGTLDVSGFLLRKDSEGSSHIEVYTTKVDKLGVDILKEKGRYSILDDGSNIPVDEADRKAIQTQIASAIIEMRNKATTEKEWNGRYMSHFGGGGMRVHWYRTIVEQTPHSRNWSDDIKKSFLLLKEAPVAEELELPEDAKSEAHRFAVAYGLSSPLGEDTPIQGFPWQYTTERVHQGQVNGKSPDLQETICSCHGLNPDCSRCNGWGTYYPGKEQLKESPVRTILVRKSPNIIKPMTPTRGAHQLNVEVVKNLKPSIPESNLSLSSRTKLIGKRLIDSKAAECKREEFHRQKMLSEETSIEKYKISVENDKETSDQKLLPHLIEKMAERPSQIHQHDATTAKPLPSMMCKYALVPKQLSIKLLSKYLSEYGFYLDNKRPEGGAWVYSSKDQFEEMADHLRKHDIGVKYYPEGRKRKSGPQYEIDSLKRLPLD